MREADEQALSQALFSAAAYGRLSEVQHLITTGADIDVWDRHGCTALTYAARWGQTDIVNFLLAQGARIEPDPHNPLYISPLTAAISHGHFAIAQLLIEKGADPLRTLEKPAEPSGEAQRLDGYSTQVEPLPTHFGRIKTCLEKILNRFRTNLRS